MKKSFSGLLLLLAPAILKAQVALSDSARIEALFRRLPFPELNAGFLYDRTPGLANLHYYAVHPEEFPESSLAFWLAVAELRDAGRNVPLPGGPDLQKVLLRFRSRPAHVFPLAILDQAFFTLSDSAQKSGLLLHDTLGFYPAPGAGFRDLVKQNRIQVLSYLPVNLLPERLVLQADEAFWFSDRGVTGIRVFRSDAKPVFLLPGDSLEWYPAREGALDLEVLHGNEVLFRRKLNPAPATQTIDERARPDEDPWWAERYRPCGGIRSTPIVAEIPFQGYEADDYPMRGVGEYSLYLSENNPGDCNLSSVRKPMILLDGFDPLDERKAECLYGKYLRFRKPGEGDRWLGDLVRGGENQYDLIILNFTKWQKPTTGFIEGGADYVERNAMILISLIQQINHAMIENGSTEKLVIAGPSMGGLISRYALSYMEKHGMDHHCRLWISFDSPQLGANIPLSVQEFVRFFAEEGNSKDARKVLDTQLGSVAARQMLLIHHSKGSLPPGPDPIFRPRFVENLTQNGISGSGGWPTQCRKVSLVNGSLQGKKFGNGCALGNALRARMASRVPLVNSLVEPFISIAELANASLRALPENGECSVFSAWIFPSKKGLTKVQPLQPGFCSLDQAPGGALDIFGSVGGRTGGGGYTPMPLDLSNIFTYSALTGSNWLRSLQILFNEDEIMNSSLGGTAGGNSFGLGLQTLFSPDQVNASFIPTKSALAYHWNQPDPGPWDEILNNRDLACQNETPFDATFGEAFNTDHVSLTEAKVDWLLEQMNSPSPPNGNGISIDLEGETQPCPFTRERFTIRNPKPGNQYFWSSPSGINMEEPGPGLSKTLGFESSSQPSTLRFQIQDPDCPTHILDRPVKPVGGLRVYSISRMNGVCPNRTFRFKVEGAEPDSWFYFSASDQQGNLYPVENEGPVGRLELPGEAMFPLQLECIVAHNSCSYTTRLNLVPEEPQPVPDFQVECQAPGGFLCYGQSPIRFSIPLGEVPAGSYIHWIPETGEPGSATYTLETEMSYGLNRSATFHLTNPGALVFRVRVEVGCSWKERLFRFDFQNTDQMVIMPSGQLCYSCQAGMLWIQAQPNPVVQSPTAEVEVQAGWQPVFPVSLRIRNVRGEEIRFWQLEAGPLRIPVKGLTSADYQLELKDARGMKASTSFVLLERENQALLISPNPAWLGRDESVRVSVLAKSDSGSSWKYEAFHSTGQPAIPSFSGGKSASISLKDVSPGSYRVRVSGSGLVLEEVLQLEGKVLPALEILPVPVQNEIRVEWKNHEPDPGGYQVLVRDKLGNIRKNERRTGTQFSMNLADLPAEVYHIQVSDSRQSVGKMFRKE